MSPSASASLSSSDEWTISADLIFEAGGWDEVAVVLVGWVEARRSRRTVGVGWVFFAGPGLRDTRGSVVGALRFVGLGADLAVFDVVVLLDDVVDFRAFRRGVLYALPVPVR